MAVVTQGQVIKYDPNDGLPRLVEGSQPLMTDASLMQPTAGCMYTCSSSSTERSLWKEVEILNAQHDMTFLGAMQLFMQDLDNDRHGWGLWVGSCCRYSVLATQCMGCSNGSSSRCCRDQDCISVSFESHSTSAGTMSVGPAFQMKHIQERSEQHHTSPSESQHTCVMLL